MLVLYLGCVLYFSSLNYVYGLWDKEVICPRLCTCRLEHITETAIHRFMQNENDKHKQPAPETIVLDNNDVFYEDEFNEIDETYYVRSATCIVQTETNPKQLIGELPEEVQSVTLIQASDSGNKSINFGDFTRFAELKIVELQSAQQLKTNPTSHFLLEVDAALQQLEFLNLERVLLKRSKLKLVNEEDVTFEYVQKLDGTAHPLTFVQHGGRNKIVPYAKYAETEKNEELPSFEGFSSLRLLRIHECKLHTIRWEMFDGLHSLRYLILERNNLRFIPDFAFYETPNLKSLSLAWNHLLNIQIADLAGLLELEYLDLSHNNFSQLSELSLPPFPNLKLANFAGNPITVVFPNTFEVMNATDSLVLGGLDEPLTLLANSFVGLKLLKTLILLQLKIPLLKREIMVGMPNLKSLSMTGTIAEVQYDAFVELFNLETLLLSKCNLSKLSMDSFVGLVNLRILDLSRNNLKSLPPGIFEDLKSIKEIYLNGNQFTELPRDIFAHTHARLIRLNENPWHCSCDMSDWKPMLVNRIKQKSIKACDSRHDKGVGCSLENSVYYKYIYENRVAPKCTTPKKYLNWSVFHVMRRQLRCAEFKPKIKKVPKHQKAANITSLEEISTEVYFTESQSTENASKLDKLNRKLARELKLQKTVHANKAVHQSNELRSSVEENNISVNLHHAPAKKVRKIRRRGRQQSNNI